MILINRPIVGLVVVVLVYLVFLASWFKLLKKTEITGVWFWLSLGCVAAMIFWPFAVVPAVAIVAWVPWPVSEPPWLKPRRK